MWTVEETDSTSPMFGRTFVWVRLSRSPQWRVRNVQLTAEALKVFQQNTTYDYDVSIQGSFFGTNSDMTKFYPLGLVISDGKRISKQTPWITGGVLAFKEGRTFISHISNIQKDFSAEQAIQSKPLVVQDGKSGIHTADEARFDRTAVGVTRVGNVIVAGVFSPRGDGATLFQFAEALIAFSTAQNDPMITAIAMDGGPGAHIYVKARRQLFGYSGETFIPNTLDFGVRRNRLQ